MWKKIEKLVLLSAVSAKITNFEFVLDHVNQLVFNKNFVANIFSNFCKLLADFILFYNDFNNFALILNNFVQVEFNICNYLNNMV